MQQAIRDAGDVGPEQLAAVLAECLAAGDPWRTVVPMFAPPVRSTGARWDDFPADLFDPRASATPAAVETLQLFS